MQETTSSINPLGFSSMGQLNVELFEDQLALEMQKKKFSSIRDKVSYSLLFRHIFKRFWKKVKKSKNGEEKFN